MVTVIIEGVTQKGKNRINEHGNEWEILTQNGNQVLLKSKADGYLKWGYEPDFKKVNT